VSFLRRVLWMNIESYRQMSVSTALICVVEGSEVDIPSNCTSTCVLVNICTHVIYVIRYSLIRVCGINIKLYILRITHIILENVCIPVMNVINRSLS